ncbi:MAG: MBL fold metallo-hydrolase [Gammaproteobacteria bacterium]|nr:MBL fold metallo-hydrolase [Gammaproteobacteria bacterium]
MSNFSERILFAAALALVAAGPSPAQAQEQDRFAKVEIKVQTLREGLYMLVGEGGNIGLSVGEDGVFLVDDQFAPLTEKIKAAVAKLSDRPVRFVINTHWHGDHTGGNENLGKAGAVIVAHDNVYQRMSRENFLAAFNTTVPPAPKAALPVITFNDTATLHLNGDDMHAVHYEHAHTDGDSVMYFKKANVIHTGDIWFNGMYPFIDVGSDGSVDGVIGAVENILTLADEQTKIIPGHGPLGDKQGLQKYLATLKDIRARVQKLIDQGKSLDEIQAARPLADYDATLGKGFLPGERFLEIVYRSLSSK